MNPNSYEQPKTIENQGSYANLNDAFKTPSSAQQPMQEQQQQIDIDSIMDDVIPRQRLPVVRQPMPLLKRKCDKSGLILVMAMFVILLLFILYYNLDPCKSQGWITENKI